MSIWFLKDYIEEIIFYQATMRYHERIDNIVYDSLVRRADKKAYDIQHKNKGNSYA